MRACGDIFSVIRMSLHPGTRLGAYSVTAKIEREHEWQSKDRAIDVDTSWKTLVSRTSGRARLNTSSQSIGGGGSGARNAARKRR